MAEPTISILEASYLQQQIVKNAKHIISGPKYLHEFQKMVHRQIKIERKFADDPRLPRYKRGIRHQREMQLMEMLHELQERIRMSFEDNGSILAKYLEDSNWMKALYISYLQQTECKLAKNKSKLMLRVDKLTGLYLDEMLDRHENPNSDDKANMMAWQLQTATRNLIGKGIPPDPAIMCVEDTDSLFSMLNKLQLIEIFYAKGLSSTYVKTSGLQLAMESILKPLRALHRGRKTTSEIFTLFKAALKALRSLYSCYGGDHIIPRDDKLAFCSSNLGKELLFWLKVTLDVRTGTDFATARREHRHVDHEEFGEFGDDSSSVATGWNSGGGAENNDSFAKVVYLFGNGLVHDLLWCVNVFIIACAHDITEMDQLDIKMAQDWEREKERERHEVQASSRSTKGRSHKEGMMASQKESMAVLQKESSTRSIGALQKESSTRTLDSNMSMGSNSAREEIADSRSVVSHLSVSSAPTPAPKVDRSHCPTEEDLQSLLIGSLQLSKIIICRYSFMQHAAEHGNPALGNVAMLRSVDEEAVVALDVASTTFSLGHINDYAIEILECGLSLCYSRSQNCNIPIATFQCFYKAALAIMQGATAEDEDANANRNPNNLSRMIYQPPNRHTTRGHLLHLLGTSSLKIMHIMNVHGNSLSVAHIGLGIIRLIAREQFMKRTEVDQLVGLEEDDFVPEPDDHGDDHATIVTKTTTHSNSVSVPNTARPSGTTSRSHSPHGPHGHEHGHEHGHKHGGHNDDFSVLSDMNTTVSNVSGGSSSMIDEPLPDIDDPEVPVQRIFNEWVHKATQEVFPAELHAHGHGKVEAVEGKHAHVVGIATLLKFIGETHTQCIEVVEQLLLLVYHLGKSSYSIKIALLEVGFEKIIQQLSVTTNHNYYVTALCSLAQEALQMDQIVL
jgi:hypothetical protein